MVVIDAQDYITQWNAANPDLPPVGSPWAARIMELVDIVESGAIYADAEEEVKSHVILD